jgi:prophage regulatory protein
MKIQILRLSAVKAQTGLSRSTIYLRIKEGAFPAPVSLGSRAVGWNSADIDRWIDQCIHSSRANKTNKYSHGADQNGGAV